MSISVLMPALSPTMTEGKLAKWHVKVGDAVKSGQVICEIETDKATMEVEAVDEGTVAQLLVAEGTEGVAVNAPILMLVEAKNEDMKRGLSQCLAEMVAAQLFNAREGNTSHLVYGVVTTGSNWRFLILQDRTVLIDLSEYFINESGKILAILLHSVA